MKKQSRKTIQNRMNTNWSLAVKIAAGFTCQHCGKKKEDLGGKKVLNSHHIVSRKYKITRWSLANGMCLCYKCHRFFAHGDDFIAQHEFHNNLKLSHSMWMKEKYDMTWHNLVMTIDYCDDPVKDLPIDKIRFIDKNLKLVVKGKL